jgi:hypothetical protein
LLPTLYHALAFLSRYLTIAVGQLVGQVSITASR